MKKVGTITFHRASNYGAVLQAYALQQFIINLGHKADIIDYRCPAIENHIKCSGFRYYIFHPMRFLRGIKHKRILVNKRHIFRKFVKEHLILSEVAVNNKTIASLNNKYDLFIVGSDQVWSPTITNKDDSFFLTFVEDDKKKVSYAASVGNLSLGVENKLYLKERLSHFKLISVREKTTKIALENLLNRDIFDVLDPVFLLEKSDWFRLFTKPRIAIPDKYLLLYLIYEDKELISFAKKIGRLNNCKIINVTENLFGIKGAVNFKKASPNNWLYLFNNAEYVVTNSFHGTSFSLIFNKHFYVKLIKDLPINSRIVDLLNDYGKVIKENEVVEVLASDSTGFVLRKKDESKMLLKKVLDE